MVNLSIWAKTLEINDEKKYYPALAHMLDTVVAAEVIFENWLNQNLIDFLTKEFGSEEQAKKALMLVSGLHDIGKVNPIFQGALLGRSEEHIAQVEKIKKTGLTFKEFDNVQFFRNEKFHQHTKIGYWYLCDLETDTQSSVGERWLELTALAHHGEFSIQYGRRLDGQLEYLKEYISEDWYLEANTHMKAVEVAAQVTIEEIRKPISHETLLIISGLVILADRLASNKKSVYKAYWDLDRNLYSLEDPRNYVEKRRKYLKEICKNTIGFASEIHERSILGEFEPRGVQKEVPNERGLWLVMAPTGAGKTEAALLRHAKEKENMVFLLPTKSTTDAMFSRFSNIYKNNTDAVVATLAHGDAALDSFYEKLNDKHTCGGLIPSDFVNGGARLSAPITVGTIDQMVMGGIPLKWSHLRILTLANSHIIIDEAHLLDPFQVELLKELFTILGKYNTRITILSATLTTKLKKDIIESYNNSGYTGKANFPSHELQPSGKEFKFSVEPYRIETQLNYCDNVIDEHISWAIDKITKYPNSRLGIFVNTVARSQEIAEILSKRLPDVTIICLHSRFMGRHKKEIVNELLSLCGTKTVGGKRIILVGTQVIEMSLDIDLDLISTDICPAPSFIQRAGRVWRDKSEDGFRSRYSRISEKAYPNLFVNIVMENYPKSDFFNPYLPYHRETIERTEAFLKNLKTLEFPNDIQNFVETSSPRFSDNSRNNEEIGDSSRKANAGELLSSNIIDFLEDYTTVYNAADLTKYNMSDEEVMTRYGIQNFPPLIICTDDKELIRLGAIDSAIAEEEIGKIELKSGSVGINAGIFKILQDLEFNDKINGKEAFAFFGSIPKELQYTKKFGLSIKK